MNRKAAQKKWARIRKAIHWDDIPQGVRQVIVGVVGSLIALAGVALLFLPGPAFVVIPLGLAILATEFVWARRWLQKTGELLKKARRKSKKAVSA